MFGFGKRDLDNDTMALIGMRAAVLARASEKDGVRMLPGVLNQCLQFAIRERGVKPSDESLSTMRSFTAALVGDDSGFTDDLFHRTLRGGKPLEVSDDEIFARTVEQFVNKHGRQK
jgi:hypothetical protein